MVLLVSMVPAGPWPIGPIGLLSPTGPLVQMEPLGPMGLLGPMGCRDLIGFFTIGCDETFGVQWFPWIFWDQWAKGSIGCNGTSGSNRTFECNGTFECRRTFALSQFVFWVWLRYRHFSGDQTTTNFHVHYNYKLAQQNDGEHIYCKNSTQAHIPARTLNAHLNCSH